ncbi:MAG: efflux RND transporter periplasmic adaptor subunit [Calditrichia bacterium]
MKKMSVSLLLLVFGLIIGITIENRLDISQILIQTKMGMDSEGMDNSSVTYSGSKDKKILYWVAPMDPNYRRNEPGKSPMGMDLKPVYESDNESGKNGSPIVKISPEVVNNLGVRTITVVRGPLSKEINTVGYLSYNEKKINHIHTRTEGWIENLTVRSEGERVKKGQPLFELYSPPLVVAQEEHLHALKNNEKRMIERTHERLISLGVSKKQIARLDKEQKVSRNVVFYSPQSGVLTKLGVRDSMFVKPELEVLSITNLDDIWLLAEVFERQANWVKVGQIAEAKLPSMPGDVWKGTVEYIYPELDPVTRTLRVRLRFDNPEEKLMPNMYAHVSIFGEEKKDVLSIPREALIRDVENERLIRALGDGRFQAQEVVAGIESGDWIEITSGLNEGDEIVVSSQFLIDSESNLKASLQRMQPIEGSMNDHSMEQSEMSK